MKKLANNVKCPARLRTLGRQMRYLRRNGPSFMFGNHDGLEAEALAQLIAHRPFVLTFRQYQQGGRTTLPFGC